MQTRHTGNTESQIQYIKKQKSYLRGFLQPFDTENKHNKEEFKV